MLRRQSMYPKLPYLLLCSSSLLLHYRYRYHYSTRSLPRPRDLALGRDGCFRLIVVPRFCGIMIAFNVTCASHPARWLKVFLWQCLKQAFRLNLRMRAYIILELGLLLKPCKQNVLHALKFVNSGSGCSMNIRPFCRQYPELVTNYLRAQAVECCWCTFHIWA